MEPNFKLAIGTYTIRKFHSGEIQVAAKTTSPINTITGSVLSSDHIIELLQLVEALRHNEGNLLDLVMPYCAFSRQDRRCNLGESFSLRVFTDLINSCNFISVTTYDNHSLVSTALINNCTDVPVAELVQAVPSIASYDFFVSTDAGANKKVFECSKRFNVPMIRADKSRDTATGAITSTDVYATADQLDGATILIIDDICANGRTFIELAKSLKVIQPNVTVHLYVTHGFFSNDTALLVGAGITHFITTDSVTLLPAGKFVRPGEHSITVINI